MARLESEQSEDQEHETSASDFRRKISFYQEKARNKAKIAAEFEGDYADTAWTRRVVEQQRQLALRYSLVAMAVTFWAEKYRSVFGTSDE